MRLFALGLVIIAVCGCAITPEEWRHSIILPEQRTTPNLDPAQLPPARIPPTASPQTVSNPKPELVEWRLSLDEAIRIALENAKVIRVLAGTTAVASGQTIYDAPIQTTNIDLSQARFDPIFSQNNTWSGTNTPTAATNPADPTQSILVGPPTQSYLSNMGLSKTNIFGGQWQMTWLENPTRFLGTPGLPLNPETPASVALAYTQPLLQGAGFRVNAAPIVIARLNTAQSFFQYKDSVQEMVRGVINAYWNLVQARTTSWATGIQVQLSKEAFDLSQGKKLAGSAAGPDVAQARVSYLQFKANLIAADAAVIKADGALRNILGIVPSDNRKIVPVSAPTKERLRQDWDAIVHLAEQRRPDIIELKLITEADSVRLLQAENQTLPTLNAMSSYQWNGLSGIMPNGDPLAAGAGKFGDWTVGINFSVPLGLRQGRAQVRQQRLLIARDQANLEQGVHGAIHDLTGTIRDLDSAYDQYLAFHEAREAAEVNLEFQPERLKAGVGSINFLNVLQALNDWGNAVLSESQQLLNYNISLATLERQTGTILETHGLVFAEERFRAAGPLLLPSHDREYPFALPLTGSTQRYPATNEPSENAFNLKNPALPDNKQKPDVVIPKPNP